MEPLTIETFNPDKIKVISSEQKRAGNVKLHFSKIRVQWKWGYST